MLDADFGLWEDGDEDWEGGFDEVVHESDLRFGDVGDGAVHEVADTQTSFFLHVALIEEFNEEEVNPFGT